VARVAFAIFFAWTLMLASSLYGDDPDGHSEVARRDLQLRDTAVQQAGQGDPIAAMRTLAAVKTPSILAQAIRDVESSLPRNRDGFANNDNHSGGGQIAGGQGGSMIDFGPLINLIQTTIAPDTWQDTVGGPGTVTPYVAGIVVDPTGLITDVEASKKGQENELLNNIAVMLARDNRQQVDFAAAKDGIGDWRLPSAIRCVSIRRLTEQIALRRLRGQPIDNELRHLAGISRVRYVVADRQNQDIVLVGQVGGIESHDGWLCDSRTGAAAIRIDYLAACLTAVLSRQPLGCSIDPTPQSLGTAADVSAAIRAGRIAEGIADEALREALGDQRVRVFGVAGDTPIAYLMVQADRHMKRLALGLEPMPRGVDNYLDVVSKHIRKGPPDGQLLRLWFTAVPMAVRVSNDASVHELGGRPMKLQSETQRAGAAGDRIAAADDVRLVDFVAGFNRNLDEIARRYPTYAALESVYHAAAVAELIHRTESQSQLGQWLGPLLMDDPSAGVLQTPKRVASIAVGHTIRQGSKRHFMVLASGGVILSPADLITGQFTNYPTLDNVSVSATASPAKDRWWWDIQR